GGESGGCTERARYRFGADDFSGCSGSDKRERSRREGCDRESRGCAARGRSEPAGSGQEDATSPACAFYETAAGSGSPSRTTISQKRGADPAPGQCRGNAANGEAGASRET